MKKDILLVANKTGSSNKAITDAAAPTGHGLRTTHGSGEAFEILSAGLHDIDLAIIDVDPGIHSLAVLEALSHCKHPSIIVVTGLEESLMKPVARRHGATARIGKPFGAAELASLIAEVAPLTSEAPPQSCDLWGHPCNGNCCQRGLQTHAA